MHLSLAPFADAYSDSVRELVNLNFPPCAETERAVVTACSLLSVWSYFDLPEGLHPTILGDDAITELMMGATLEGN